MSATSSYGILVVLRADAGVISFGLVAAWVGSGSLSKVVVVTLMLCCLRVVVCTVGFGVLAGAEAISPLAGSVPSAAAASLVSVLFVDEDGDMAERDDTSAACCRTACVWAL